MFSPFYSKQVHEAVKSAIEAHVIDCTDADTYYVAVPYGKGEYRTLMYTRDVHTLLGELDALRPQDFPHVMVEKPGQVVIDLVSKAGKYVPRVTFLNTQRLYRHA